MLCNHATVRGGVAQALEMAKSLSSLVLTSESWSSLLSLTKRALTSHRLLASPSRPLLAPSRSYSNAFSENNVLLHTLRSGCSDASALRGAYSGYRTSHKWPNLTPMVL